MRPGFAPHVLAAVFLGGAVGTLTRWGLQSLAGSDPLGAALATLVINTAGVFGMAAAAAWTAQGPLWAKGLVNAGFFGGLTTFSAVMLLLVRPPAGAVSGSSAAGLLLSAGWIALSVSLGWAAARLGASWAAGASAWRAAARSRRGEAS